MPFSFLHVDNTAEEPVKLDRLIRNCPTEHQEKKITEKQKQNTAFKMNY